jgi:hypothetical protein
MDMFPTTFGQIKSGEAFASSSERDSTLVLGWKNEDGKTATQYGCGVETISGFLQFFRTRQKVEFRENERVFRIRHGPDDE